MNPTANNTRKLTISAMVMALYIVIMYFTQSFAFGEYQVRIATTLYAAGYFYPFLIVPIGLANLFANLLMGGFGIVDALGGCAVGIVTTALIVLIRRRNWSPLLVAVPIVLVPGFGVSTYLSQLLQVPYLLLALKLCIGQLTPAICGVVFIHVLSRHFKSRGVLA